MTVKENHYRCGWDNQHIINVSKYNERGLDLKYFYQRKTKGLVPTQEEVITARKEAFKQEDSAHHVIITYMDANNVPINSRNAPLDGNSEDREKDFYGFTKSPKMRVDLDGDQFYDWKPLNNTDCYKYRKKL